MIENELTKLQLNRRRPLLEDLGLDSETESVYRYLVINRNSSVKQIVDNLPLSELSVKTAMSQLADLMLLQPSREASDQQRLVDPELALQSLLQRAQADILAKQQRFAASQVAASQLVAEYTAADSSVIRDGIEWLDGMDTVQARLEKLANRAVSGCTSLMPDGGQSAETLTASMPLDKLMLGRGLAVSTVYLDSVRNHAASVHYTLWLNQLGGSVRTKPTLPLQMMIFDQGVGLVPIDPLNIRLGAVQLTVPGLVAALMALFDCVWESAAPLGEELKHIVGEPTAQERELIRLLSHGLTDTVTARRLGLSLRTERRMVANLMRQLGANSRFEAGLRACERRWI